MRDTREHLKIFREKIGFKTAKSFWESLPDDLTKEQSSYSKVENGKLDIDIQLIEYLNLKHDLNIHWFFTGEGSMQISDVQIPQLGDRKLEYEKPKGILEDLISRVERLEEIERKRNK